MSVDIGNLYETENGLIVKVVERDAHLIHGEVISRKGGGDFQRQVIHYNEKGICCLPRDDAFNWKREIEK